MVGDFAGQLVLWLLWDGDPGVFHEVDTLSRPLKVKWMQARVSQVSMC